MTWYSKELVNFHIHKTKFNFGDNFNKLSYKCAKPPFFLRGE